MFWYTERMPDQNPLTLGQTDAQTQRDIAFTRTESRRCTPSSRCRGVSSQRDQFLSLATARVSFAGLTGKHFKKGISALRFAS
jgi:hypothetical protein